MATVLLLVAGGSLLALGSAASTTVTEPLVPLDTATLTSNMRHWTTDYAVMFYAPWCQHCKRDFMPLWEDVSMQLAEEDPKGKRKLVMGKFDCEQDIVAAAFCQEIKLQFYPTFMFFGAGKFHDYDPLSGVVTGPRPTEHDSSAKFPSGAMVYQDVMAGWTKTMHLISGSNRLMERINIFGGRGKNAASAEQKLVAEMEALERQNHQLQEAMSRGGSGGAGVAGEGAGELAYVHGDPYRELHEVAYDAQFEPVMLCVIDMAMQYCDVEGIREADPWCSTLDSCVATDFAGDECWPSTCPLLDEGCQITSFCLTSELLESYVDLYNQEEELDGAAAAAAAGEEAREEHWMGPEGGTAAETMTAAAEEKEGQTGEAAEQPGGTAPALPPFFGRRPAAGVGGGGVDRAGDDRGDTVAA
eukprot:g8331.t1